MAPLLANGCWQHGLAAWCVKDVQPRMQGRCFVTRFADDCSLGCELEAAARRVMAVLPKRFNRSRLTMHPAQTALMACKRPPSREPSAGRTGNVAWLGLPHSWATTRRGDWGIKRKTGGKRLRRFMQAIGPWCRDNRHAPLQEQYRTLCATRRG
jgi:hypothetical protein